MMRNSSDMRGRSCEIEQDGQGAISSDCGRDGPSCGERPREDRCLQ